MECGNLCRMRPVPPPSTSPTAALVGKFRWRELGLVALILVVAFGIWHRNRDILSDMYDYSSVIVSAGKVESGLKPYVDFRSTMQSACYVLSRGVEKVFGRNYLALTYGGLVLILGGGRRRRGQGGRQRQTKEEEG